MVRLDKFDHIYLVYHFTVPLSFFLLHFFTCICAWEQIDGGRRRGAELQYLRYASIKVAS